MHYWLSNLCDVTAYKIYSLKQSTTVYKILKVANDLQIVTIFLLRHYMLPACQVTEKNTFQFLDSSFLLLIPDRLRQDKPKSN